MTTKYYLLALANEIEGTPLRLYADAFRNSIAKIKTQSARITELEAALQDMAKHVWRGDWDKLKPETRALLDEKK